MKTVSCLMMMMMKMWMMAVLTISTSTAADTICPSVGDNSPSMDEIVYYSDLVVQGLVSQHYSNPDNPEVFTAEMIVHCVFKGSDVPERINITSAGNASDACFSTVFQIGQTYLAYLHREKDGSLTPKYPENPESYTDELYIMCDVNVTFPVGVTKESADWPCEDPAGDYEYEGEEKPPCIPTFVPKDPEYKSGKSEDEQPKDEPDDGTDGNGCGLLRMSFILLALLPAVVFMFT